MTDKQIIIDGIDVSGCRYLFDDTSYKRSKTSCSITLKDCKYLGNNCYYKQLKRKEKECSTSNKYAIGFARKCQRLELDIFHLKDENNKLKRKEQKLEKIKEISKEYKVEYTVNNGVQLLTNKVIEIIEGKENE